MPKITLKRVTNADGTVAVLYPTTTVDQIFTVDSSGNAESTTLDSHLTSTYIPLTQRGQNNGVATLGSTGKVPESQLPSSVFGGMRLINTLQSGDTLTAEALMDLAQTYVSNNGGVLEGSYFLIGGSTALTISGGTDNNNNVVHTFIAEQTTQVAEESDSSFPITLEPGDWLVMGGQWTLNTTTYQRWAVVNNTYQEAEGQSKGIVELISTSANAGSYNNPNNMVGLSDGSSRVITEDFLFGNRISGELNSGTDSNGDADGSNQTATKLAMSDHIHDGRYYTETEINSFFSGGTSITGYNRQNWNDAYGDTVATAEFDTSDGVLTLNRVDTGTVTVDLDGRYVESATLNSWFDGTAIDGHNFTEIKYGASLESNLPSSGNIVGTLLIETD